MQRSRFGVRLSAAVATMLLLAAGAACSKQEPLPTLPTVGASPSTSAAGTPGSTPGAGGSPTAGPSSAAPGPSATTGSTLPPPATTAVPAPTPGSTAETVPAKPEVTKKAVKLDKPSEAGGGVVVRITDVKAIRAKAQLPGEVAGPAVALTVQVKNGSSRAVDLGSVVVTLLDSDDAPGIEMSAKPADPLSGTLKPGKTTTGVYVFTVGPQRRNPISVNVTLAGAAPVLLFTGNVT